MDFFEQQHQARRHTALMVFLFVAAVAAIVIAVDVVAAVTWLALTSEIWIPEGRSPLAQVPAPVYLWASVATLAIIAGGTLHRMVSLSQGGVAVARMVGARWVKRNSEDPQERRLLNVVEEMAIASGITVPSVFVMDDEHGINAFAAGYSPNEASITVTRGALERLDRDELQGVIGHEFSHILNGDMRLNVRLLGVIAGIVLIGAIGRFVMDLGRGGSKGNSRRGDIRLFLLGLALWLLGWIGVLFGRLIKAAISRQREYLADAASVQFTRNPEGLGCALYDIGRTSGLISNRYAEDLSHMYFGQAVKKAFTGLLDTHPPIEDRIHRVLGERALLVARMHEKKREAGGAAAGADTAAAPAASPLNGDIPAAFASAPMAPPSTEWGRRSVDGAVSASADAVMASVGKAGPQHIDQAKRILAEIPPQVRAAAVSEDGAKAALFALLTASGGELRNRQAALIREATGEALAAKTLEIAEALAPLGARARLPVLYLAIPTLKALPQPEREGLLNTLQALVDADQRVTLSEFVLITICRRHFGKPARGAPPVKYRSIEPLAKEAAVIVSLLVQAGRASPDAFVRAMDALGLRGQTLRPAAELNIRLVEGALYEMKLLAPLAKPGFIKACLAVVMAQDTLSLAQAELMRAICAALDTPLPPILEDPLENLPAENRQ